MPLNAVLKNAPFSPQTASLRVINQQNAAKHATYLDTPINGIQYLIFRVFDAKCLHHPTRLHIHQHGS